MSAAIELTGVGKRFRRGRSWEHWALRDLDLSVAPGETIGVVGRNGSGKTTLLRLLAGVSAPTTGRLVVRGRVAPLIGVGVGFDPELTGRENVGVNARILGLSKAEATRLHGSIVEFSELGDAVEMPVKLYSSGMFLRLAFAVAVHVRPEVLLVDEVLAVGDLAFQLKCLERMRELQAAGTTVVVVTHNLDVLRRMCDRGVVLSKGRMLCDGTVDEAIGTYHAELARTTAAAGEAPVAVDVEGGHHVGGGTPLRLRVQGESPAGPAVAVRVTVSHPNVPTVYEAAVALASPAASVDVVVELAGRLLGGSYSVAAVLLDADGRAVAGSDPVPFFVGARGRPFGIGDVDLRLSVGGRAIDLRDDALYLSSES